MGSACLGEQDTPVQVRLRALADARRQALEQAAGVEVQSQTLVTGQQLQSDWVRTFSRARIAREEILQEGWGNATATAPGCYQVRLKAWVEAVPPAQHFQAFLSLDKPLYRAGETAQLTLRVTQPAYITLFSVGPDETVYLLQPSLASLEPLYLQPGQSYVFPSPEQRQAGLSLRAHALPGQTAVEHIRLIATRDPVKLIDLTVSSSGYQLPRAYGLKLYQHLQQQLFLLDPDSWADAQALFQVAPTVTEK